MKREVIQNFLNLPGVAGVALIDDRSRPCFLGIDRTLNTQQRDALAQGIRQVLSTIPQDFESLEFQFTNHHLYIYKLNHSIIMLVLAYSTLDYTNYIKALHSLKNGLETDITQGVATFRLLASEITLSGQQFARKLSKEDAQQTVSKPTDVLKAANEAGLPTSRYPATPLASLIDQKNHRRLPEDTVLTTRSVAMPSQPDRTKVSSPKMTPSTAEIANYPPATPSLAQPTLKEFIAAVNILSHFTTKYLGTAVIANYWKTCRPDNDWLKQFTVDWAAKITITATSNCDVHQPINPEQLQLLRMWVHSFIERCTVVIRDYPQLLSQSTLTDRQRSILL
ncbi:MAG: hypothetical protein NZ772_03075 [Cyanobacteria bacterium]|nr:hypothetical protein [Cyanobacteriota bacterium]MDW8200467.1 hypothetical protein [Cyanobacteriota bacterium SKYGB_h_bin112]